MKEYFYNIIIISAASGVISLVCKGARCEKLLERITALCLIAACFMPIIGANLEIPDLPTIDATSDDSENEVIITAGENICSTVKVALFQIYGITSKVTAELDVSDKSNIVITKVSAVCDGGNPEKIEKTICELVGECEVEVKVNIGG